LLSLIVSTILLPFFFFLFFFFLFLFFLLLFLWFFFLFFSLFPPIPFISFLDLKNQNTSGGNKIRKKILTSSFKISFQKTRKDLSFLSSFVVLMFSLFFSSNGEFLLLIGRLSPFSGCLHLFDFCLACCG